MMDIPTSTPTYMRSVTNQAKKDLTSIINARNITNTVAFGMGAKYGYENILTYMQQNGGLIEHLKQFAQIHPEWKDKIYMIINNPKIISIGIAGLLALGGFLLFKSFIAYIIDKFKYNMMGGIPETHSNTTQTITTTQQSSVPQYQSTQDDINNIIDKIQ